MSLRYIRHLGNINPDHVTAVRVVPAKLSYGDVRRYRDGPKKGRVRARRAWFGLGRVVRPHWDFMGGGSRRRAHVNVWYQGEDWPTQLDDTTDGDAKRQAEEIREDLRAPLATESIVAAALNWNGMVVSLPPPARHPDLIRLAYEAREVPVGAHEQGFLTSRGRYVSRKEAFLIALASGQLPVDKVHPHDRRVTPDLFTEDLW